MLGLPSPVAAAANLVDATLRGGIADTRRMPSALIDEGPQAICFDLRRGCSLAENLLRRGRETYLVDYGPVRFGDRALGREHWIVGRSRGAAEAAWAPACGCRGCVKLPSCRCDGP